MSLWRHLTKNHLTITWFERGKFLFLSSGFTLLSNQRHRKGINGDTLTSLLKSSFEKHVRRSTCFTWSKFQSLSHAPRLRQQMVAEILCTGSVHRVYPFNHFISLHAIYKHSCCCSVGKEKTNKLTKRRYFVVDFI